MPLLKRRREAGIAWFLVAFIIIAVVAILVWVVVQVLDSLGNLFPKKQPEQGQIVPWESGGVDPRSVDWHGLLTRGGPVVLVKSYPLYSPDGTNITFNLVVRGGNGPAGPWDTWVWATNFYGNPTNLPAFLSPYLYLDASNILNWRALDPAGTNGTRFYNVREER